MTTIQVKNMTFTYNGSYNPVFEDVSFNLDTSWKLGFTGRNGRGKTTFLKLLMGQADQLGRLTGRIDHNTACDFFPYAIAPEQMTLLTYQVVEAINPNYEHWQLVREMNLLALDESLLYRTFGSLSQGERTKMQLAVLFLKASHFLLIDEPTNHLDIHGRALVASYLNSKRGFILVSHDRVFLDACVDHVLSIHKTKIEIFQGNFSTYFANKARRDAFEQAENAKLSASIRLMGEAVKRTAGWSHAVEATKCGNGHVDRGYIGAKSEKMMKRALAIEARRQRAIAQKQTLLHDIEHEHPLELKALVPSAAYRGGYESAKPLLGTTGLSVTYGDHIVLKDVSFSVFYGERIAIEGSNGSGKSTLLKALEASIPSNLSVSYVSQDTSHLTESLRAFVSSRQLDEGLFKSMLHKLDFKVEQFDIPMAQFSEGQKKKVLLAASICERAHLYIWDEPLNYIDVISRIQIEAMILEYAPTLVFVEHDMAFVDRVATRKFSLRGTIV